MELCNLINQAAELANSIELLYSSSSARSPHHLEFYEHIKVVKVSLARVQGSSIPLSAAESCSQLHQALQESYASVQKYLKRSPSAAMSFLKRPVEKKKLRKLNVVIEQSFCDILLQQQQHENSTAAQAAQVASPFERTMPVPPPPAQKRPKFIKRITSGLASAVRRLTGRPKPPLGPVVTPGQYSLHTLSHTLYNNNLATKKVAGTPSGVQSPSPHPDTSQDPTSTPEGGDVEQQAKSRPSSWHKPAAVAGQLHTSQEWPVSQTQATNSAMSQMENIHNSSNIHHPTSNTSVSQATPMSDLSTPMNLHINKSPNWSTRPSYDGMQYPSPNGDSMADGAGSKPHVSGPYQTGTKGVPGAGDKDHDMIPDVPSGDSVALAGPPHMQRNVQVQYNIVFNDDSVGDKSSAPASSEAPTTNSGMPSLPSITTRAQNHGNQHASYPLCPSSQSPGAAISHPVGLSTEPDTTVSPHSPTPPSMHDVSAGPTTAPPTNSSHPSPRTAPSSTDAGSSLPPRPAGWQADVGTQAHFAGPGTEHSSVALSSKGDPTLSSKGEVVLVSQQHSSTQQSGLQSSQRDSARSSRKTGQGPVSDFSVGSSEFTSRQFSSVVASGSGFEEGERIVPADALSGEATAVPAGHSSLTWICSNLSTSWLGQVVDLRGHTVSAPPSETNSTRRHNPTVPLNAPMRLMMERPADGNNGSVWEVCPAPRNAPIWVIGSVGTTLRNGHIDLPADGFLVLDATCRGVTLQNITVKGGTLVCYGGGCNVWLQAVTLDGCNLMAVAGSDVTLSHCTLLHCPAAIVASGPNTRLSAGDCELSNNALGACADNGAQLLLSRITIKGSEGSGAECRGEGSCLQARQCTIGGNSAGWTGGSSEVFTNCVHVHTGGSVSLHACVLERTECGLRAEGEGVVAEARGCTVRGAGRCGARVGPGAAAWIEGCTIKGSKSTTAYGIVVSGGDARADLLDCALMDNGRAAVAVHRAAAVGLRGCTLANSRRSSGIQVDDAASCVEASDCVIKENEVCGAAVRGGGQVELRGCSLTGPKQSFGVSASGSKTLIRVVDCTMDNNKLCGLHVARGATAAVRQCALGGPSQRVGMQVSGKDTQVDVQDCMLRKNLKVAARVRSGATLHLLRCTLCSSKESDGLHACDIGTNVRACDCAMHDNSQTAACVWKGAKAKLIDCALSGTRSGCGLHVSGKGTHATVRRCTLGENSVAGAHVSSTATAKLTACELVGTRGGPGLCAAGAGTRVVATKCAAQGNAAAGFFATRNAAIAVRECTGERNCRAPGGAFSKGKDVQIEESGEGDKGTYASGEGGCILHVRVGDKEQQQSYLSEPIPTSGKENDSTIGDEELVPGQGAMDRKGISDPGLGRAGTSAGAQQARVQHVQIARKLKDYAQTAVAATITGGTEGGAAVLEVAKGSDVSDKELASMMRRATFHSMAKVQESAFDVVGEPASATHSQIKLLGAQARQAAGGRGSGKK